MYKAADTRQCLICHESLENETHLFSYLYHPQICQQCILQLEILEVNVTIQSYPALILYRYNDFFKKILFQYKALDDYALKDAFLNPFYDFKTRYRRHLIAIVPSSDEDNKRRGFNPNEMIVQSFSNNIFTGLYKTSSYKQASQNDRSLIKQHIKIKDGHRLFNQDVIIFDDVITSGNTIMACANLIASFHPKSISIIVLASNQIDNLFT